MDEQNNPNSPNSLKQIRTFQGDVAQALSSQEESLVSIQQKEAERRKLSGIPLEEKDEDHKNFVFLLIGSLFFLIVGSVGGWYAFQVYKERTAPPVLVVPESRLIAPNREVVMDVSNLSRESLALKFRESISKTGLGELTHVVFREGALETSSLLTPSSLMKLLESRAPGSLVRAFDKVFMAGAIEQSPFLIIKLSSFENAFAGMLTWEENMADDLTPIFGNAEEVKATPVPSVFKDVILRNKDVRVLSFAASTTEGIREETVLLYSFFDNKMLIITDSLEALQTLIDRLTRERLSH